MIEIKKAAELRQVVAKARRRGESIGLVPTMGYLHPGHTRLIDEAVSENDLVVVSIYVNPSQFGPTEDFERYPRDPGRDRILAAESGAGVAFLPSDEDMYPAGVLGQKVWVDPGDLARHLCGASRPGHFRGVATVVAKLFHIVQPDRAYFGQKDAQQAIILKTMVRDLAMPVDLRVVATVREADGLALSSRNVYLSSDERRQAVALKEALDQAQRSYQAGNRDSNDLRAMMRGHLNEKAPLGRVEYADIVDLDTLTPTDRALTSNALAAVAVFFGSTRLIDNTVLSPDGLLG